MTVTPGDDAPGIVNPNRGQSWRHTGTGEVVRVAGNTTRATVFTRADGTPDKIDRAEFCAQYEFLDCDHAAACCELHGTHLSPHQGCIFR